MKTTILLITIVLLAGCNRCPESTERIIYKTKIIHDTIMVIPPPDKVCESCLKGFEAYTTHYWDSIKGIYYSELEQKIAHFENWRDSTISAVNISTALRQRTIDSLAKQFNEYYIQKSDSLRLKALKLDSFKNTIMYDNMFFYENTGAARAEFDSVTGKPVLIFE